MSVRGKQILCMGYGGGHMRMLVPVAQELAARGAELLLLPLNVGVKDARGAGLPMQTLEQVLDAMGCAAALEPLGRAVAAESGHPAISDRETWLYHGLGMADLVAEHGEEAARATFAQQGRKAFHPLSGWRRILAHMAPDLLITTNAPRSESAALAAARASGLPALCVTDHFLVYEIDYVSRPGHGDLITVLGQAVADFLVRHGRPAEEIRVTGNAAFDTVFDPAYQDAAIALRASLGWQDKRVILWPQQSGTAQVGGKPLIPPEDIAPVLLEVLDRDPELRLVVRPHPNNPGGGVKTEHPQIVFSPEPPIEALVHAADIVVQQSTTVGIQAALAGKRVITIANAGMPPFAEYGLAQDVPGVEALPEALLAGPMPDVSRLGAPAPGRAGGLIADAAAELLARR